MGFAVSASMEAESSAGVRKRQRVTPYSASASTAGFIPEELVREILLRVPSRSVLRFRAVCKTWLRLTSCPEFAREHHHRQPELPLVSFLRDASGDAADCCLEALDLRADEIRPVARFTDSRDRCGGFRVLGSCDGLLLLAYEHRVYVCNPATHQWTRLPTPLASSSFAGFYRHEPTGEYRALFYRGYWPGPDYCILVADAKKGRGIGLASEKQVYRFKENPGGPPALVHGSLHWPPQKQYENLMLVFNTVTEVFHGIFPPVAREHMSLLVVENKLAMFSCGKDATSLELWLMQDYENMKWVCRHSIGLPEMNVSTFQVDEPWRVFFMSEEGVVLVIQQQNEQKLLHYDLNGNLKESFRSDGHQLRITPYTLKESLVKHKFFEIQDNSDADEDESLPPFFQGM